MKKLRAVSFILLLSYKVERTRERRAAKPRGTRAEALLLFIDSYGIDYKTVRIFAYSSKPEQSNKRSGTRKKTESETGERR